MIESVFPLHPITVHMPIGLLIGNMILSLLVLRSQDQTAAQSLDSAAYHCLRLGTLFLLPAIGAGIMDAARYWLGQERRDDVLLWLNLHAIFGALLLIVYWQAWQIRRRTHDILLNRNNRRGYLTRLCIGCILLILSGWIGGHMVYQFGVGMR